jgi:subtilisin family serine protease
VLNKERLLGIAILTAIFAFAWWGTVKYIDKPAEDPYRKIVVFEEMSPEGKHEADLINSLGGKVLKFLPVVQGIVAQFPDNNVLDDVANHPSVAWVEDDFYISGKINTEGLASLAGKEISRPADVALVPGRDIVKIGVLDSGVDFNHPWLSQFLGEGINVLDPMKKPIDVLGHGTHVSGIIARTVGQLTAHKVKVKIYPVKVFNYYGQAYLSDIIYGLQWCLKEDISVINMSFGTVRYSRVLEEAVKKLNGDGVILIGAAGNKGPKKDSVLYPAKFPEVVAVNASDGSGNIAVYSSRGPEIIFIAPGTNIESTWKNGGYSKETGTSMAAPQVAGAAAVIIGLLGSVSQQEIVARLRRYTVDLDLPQECQGFGRINFDWLKEELNT